MAATSPGCTQLYYRILTRSELSVAADCLGAGNFFLINFVSQITNKTEQTSDYPVNMQSETSLHKLLQII